jgi:5-methylcytosine-specific restriction endonuclease McrA
MATSKPGKIHELIVEVMKRFPDGITGGQIRKELEKEGLRAEDQTHLDRRKRDLKKWFLIATVTATQIVNGTPRKVTLYKYIGKRKKVTDEGDINIRVKFEVRRAARGRCQVCGKTVAEDNIKLVVDHKKPRAWGGTNDLENLWAICEECNAGKKAYFNSMDSEFMKKVTSHQSVHVRIGETLKAMGIGKRTPPWLLDVVADQEDWHKRLRELRYPVIGWDIGTVGYKTKSGRKKVDYILRSYKPWPSNPTAKIRQFERDRGRHNQAADD